MSEATVLYETRAGVGIVTLNRPQALNSFHAPDAQTCGPSSTASTPTSPPAW